MTFAVSTPPSPSFAFVDQPFAERALCAQVDPDAWYPEKGESNTVAKRVCAACPVTADCLAWALTTNQRWGVLGGLSTKERDRARRAKKTTGLPRVSSSMRTSSGVSAERIETAPLTRRDLTAKTGRGLNGCL